MQTVPSPTDAPVGAPGRNPMAIAAAIEALQGLDHATFLEVIAREADRRHERIVPVGRTLARELWEESSADTFPAPAFDESVWAEIRRDGRWDHVIDTAVRDVRDQAALIVDIVMDARAIGDDRSEHAPARRHTFDDDE